MSVPNAKTLFHLVPRNAVARDALALPDNRPFVSTASNRQLGLEVGFHVPSTGGYVITRLGRKGDLVLTRNTVSEPMCREHVAFEFEESTKLVHLSVRSKKQVPTVSVGLLLQDSGIHLDAARDPRRGFEDDTPDNKIVDGEAVILYGQNYNIQISSYSFALIWRIILDTPNNNNQRLAELAEATCKQSLSLLKVMGSRDMPTGAELSELVSHRITRPRTSKQAVVREDKTRRRQIGEGAFGKVYMNQDQETSAWIAIKVIQLRKFFKVDGFDINRARAIFHRELRVMQSTNHPNIIQYLGYGEVDTMEPEIIMPFCASSAEKMFRLEIPETLYQETCWEVLEQMLCALDYLASLGYVHRDLKPENILYDADVSNPGHYLFRLADFGLANHQKLAHTMCGTVAYQAPELWPRISNLSQMQYKQDHKMDVWSLYATFVALSTRMKMFPPRSTGSQEQFYNLSRNTLIDSAKTFKALAPMAILEPDRRASAAWMLNALFEGRGLTTKPGKIEPYYPPGSSPPRSQQVQPAPVHRWSSKMDIDDPPNVPASRPVTRQGGRIDVDVPLIVHSRAVLDRRDAQLVQQKIRKQGGGVIKRRAKPRHPVTIR
ncbi:mutagen sensitive-59 [Colletotrichum cuscutae]|uniref:non-specific serine/threonine protein kinase n=1 Tax=Colletotrichum cuscutae TaxID=1209917 RepID=A0AAJ0DQZ6_9PEZI|nr:mutagen sensitive-59 [Colletotrichum cuscutae]